MSDRSVDWTRVLGLAGVGAGVIWAMTPIVAGLAFYGLESGVWGVRGIAGVGAVFQFVGLAVPGFGAGLAGLVRRSGAWVDRRGQLGAIVAGAGVVLLLPGSFIPSGTAPSSLAGLVAPAFFLGLGGLAIGSAVLGYVTWRSGTLPGWLAVAFGAAMPAGGLVGGLAALAGAGTLALVIGLMTPYGLAWVGVGWELAIGRRQRVSPT